MLQYIIPPKALLPYEKEIRDRIANNGHKGMIDNLQKHRVQKSKVALCIGAESG